MGRCVSITTIAEARAALDYCNAFHDSFVRHFQLRSHEQIDGVKRLASTRTW
jgi:hypothetical protein